MPKVKFLDVGCVSDESLHRKCVIVIQEVVESKRIEYFPDERGRRSVPGFADEGTLGEVTSANFAKSPVEEFRWQSSNRSESARLGRRWMCIQ